MGAMGIGKVKKRGSVMRKIPISQAKRLAKEYGWDQVIIYARNPGEDGRCQYASYGKDKKNCDAAGRIAETIMNADIEGSWPKPKPLGGNHEEDDPSTD